MLVSGLSESKIARNILLVAIGPRTIDVEEC